jgi:hypothetical protein
MSVRTRLQLGVVVGLIVGGLGTYGAGVLRGQALQPAGKAGRAAIDVAPSAAGNQPPPGYYQPDALRFQLIQMDSRRPYLLDSSSGQLWVLGQQEWVVYAPAPGSRQ